MWLIQAAALLVALGLLSVIVARKVEAEPRAGADKDAAPAPPKSDRRAEKPADKKDKMADAPDKGAPKADKADDKKAARADAKKGDKADDTRGDDPVDYAVIQTDADFDPDLSDEEKAAIGTGKVPIHREGPYKSPLAHPRFGGPTTVKVGLVIREIREFNIQTGGFEADFFLSLTGDKALPQLNLGFNNGHEVNLQPIVDSPTFKLFSVTGKFTTSVDLREYPFDTQLLYLSLEDTKAGVDQLIFQPDQNRTSLDSSFRLAGFSAAGVGAIAYKHKYPPRFDRDDLYVSRYRFGVSLQRFATSAAFSVYVPALIIVLISLTGMWVPPSMLELRANAGAPMLAAAVLFHYSLIQALPATGYLTHADKLMLGVYVSLLLNMVSTTALLFGDEEQSMRVFRWARTGVPFLTVLIMLASVLI